MKRILILAAVLALSGCATEEKYDYYNSYDTNAAYTAGYDQGREKGAEIAVDDLLYCARQRAQTLYYGEDEYEAVTIDDLDDC